MTFTPEVIRQDGAGRIANTIGQVTVPGALVVVGEWLAQEVGWNGELPTEVSAALIALLTALAAWLTNRRRLRGEA